MCIVNKTYTKKCVQNQQEYSQIFVHITNRLYTDICVQYSYKVKQNRPTQNQSNIFKEVVIMCMTKKELEAKVEEIRKYKAMIEEASNIEKALEAEVISYMNENNLTEEITDTAKITYKSQTRATLDKKRLEEDLGSLEEYTKTTTYSVLRIK